MCWGKEVTTKPYECPYCGTDLVRYGERLPPRSYRCRQCGAMSEWDNGTLIRAKRVLNAQDMREREKGAYDY